MKRRIGYWLILVITAVAASMLAACASVNTDNPLSTTVLQPTATKVVDEPDEKPLATATQIPPDVTLESGETPPETVVETPSDPLERKLVVLASEDLAALLDIDIDQIHLVSIDAVTWPDASLGCPQPNTMYAQVRTPGYRIVLQVGEQLYNYHSDIEGSFLLCDPNSLPVFQRTPVWRQPSTD